MRRILFLSALCVILSLNVQAQDRSIRFEKTRVWKEIVAKAKQEKKLIFIDFFTSWCVPCKELAEKVFTRNEVADFFNKNFVCAHFDVEKDSDGKMLFLKIGGEAVPTLSFIDPNTEELVLQVVGAGDQKWLMEQGKAALDPKNSLTGFAKRFQAGERDSAFIYQYLQMLQDANLMKQRKQLIFDYLESLSDEQLATRASWEMITANVKNPLDKSFQRVMDLREKFYQNLDKEEVDYYLTQIITMSVETLSDGQIESRKMFNQERYEKLLTYLRSLHYPAVPGALARLYVGDYMRKGDFDGMLQCMREAMETNVFVNGDGRLFFIDNIGKLALCNDTTIINKGIAWLDEEFRSTDNSLYQANLLHIKSDLLKYIGNENEASKAKKLEDMYLREANKKSGVYIMRAFKMYNRPRGEGNRLF